VGRLSAPPSKCRVNQRLRCNVAELRPLSPFIASRSASAVEAARAQTPTWAGGRYGDLQAPSIAQRLPHETSEYYACPAPLLT
jgi:hypothetical protein